MPKLKEQKTPKISPEVEKRIKEIEEKIDTEYMYEMYATRYETIVDTRVQDDWLKTEIGIDHTGKEEADRIIAKNVELRAKVRSQLDLIKANIK